MVELRPSALIPPMICIYLRSRPRRRPRSLVYRLDAVGGMAAPWLEPESAAAASASTPLVCRASARGQPFERLVFRLQAAWGLHASRSMAQWGAHADRPPPRIRSGRRPGWTTRRRWSYLFCKRGNQRQGLLALPLRTKLDIQREKATPAEGRPAPAARRMFIEIRIDPRQNSAPIDPSRPRSRPF